MVNGGRKFSDVRKTWEMNEAIILKDQKDRARPSQIENIGRAALIKNLLDMGPRHPAYQRCVLDYEPFIITSYEDDLSEKITPNEDAFKVLDAYSKKTQKSYAPFIKDESVKEDFANLIASYKNEISSDELMSTTIPEEDIGTEVQLELELDAQLELVDLVQELEVNQEVQQEWHSYNFQDNAAPYNEILWGMLDPAKPLYPQIEAKLLSLSTELGRTEFNKRKISPKVKEYARCFPDNLKMTRNFYQTSAEDLPLLHPHCKEAKFVLMTKAADRTWQFILVSEKDAAFFKSWVHAHQVKGVYLVDCKGMPEAEF